MAVRVEEHIVRTASEEDLASAADISQETERGSLNHEKLVGRRAEGGVRADGESAIGDGDIADKCVRAGEGECAAAALYDRRVALHGAGEFE